MNSGYDLKYFVKKFKKFETIDAAMISNKDKSLLIELVYFYFYTLFNYLIYYLFYLSGRGFFLLLRNLFMSNLLIKYSTYKYFIPNCWINYY